MRTARNILQHELIGMEVEVNGATASTRPSLRGTILDESRNTVVIEQDNRELMLPKHGMIFTFELPADDEQRDKIIRVVIDGDALIARPEDRIKRNEVRTNRK